MDQDKEIQEFVFYVSPEGAVKVDVLIHDETVWLTQKRMAELFGVSVPTINEHLQSVYDTAELSEKSTIRKFRIVQNEGGREVEREVNFYNLDAIISVGYRVNSAQATHFRKWATTVLRDYIIKGFAMDDELLKNGTRLGKDYFQELIERIREIRASERRFYQKITDIYSTAIDYDRNAEITQTFFKTVQNKLHFAIHGRTAAELIAERASAKKPHMGLTAWKNSPNGKILKTDVTVGKNYLEKEEIDALNRIVSMYLDYAENQAKRGRSMTMQDWRDKLDAFLIFNEYEILSNPGKVSMETAKKLAEKEYDKFRVVQDREFRSDFDKFVERTKKIGGGEEESDS
jgi:hypothetical protein